MVVLYAMDAYSNGSVYAWGTRAIWTPQQLNEYKFFKYQKKKNGSKNKN